jgi:hypothetical protein
LLLDRDVRAAWLDRQVQTFVLVESFRQRGIEAPMFGLRVPIGLEDYFCQPATADRVTASLHKKAGDEEKEDVEKTLAHVHESVSESGGQHNTRLFVDGGLIVSMQNLNMASEPGLVRVVIN